jgi:hypothetical protein
MWITNGPGGRARILARIIAAGLAVAMAGCQGKPGSGSGGAGPTLTPSVATHNFGKVLVGESVTLAGVNWVYSGGVGGSASVDVTSPLVSGDDAEFATTRFGTTTLDGQAKTPAVTVTFAPTRGGTLTADLTPQVIRGSAAVTPLNVTGQGVSVITSGTVAMKEGTANLDTSRVLDFKEEIFPGGKKIRTLTIVNSGPNPVVLKETWNKATEGFSVTTAGPFVVPARGRLDIDLQFSPIGVSGPTFRDVLRLDDGGGNSARVSVMGKGRAPAGQ